MNKTYEHIAEEIKERTNNLLVKTKVDVVYDEGEAQHIDVYDAKLNDTIHYINPIIQVAEYYDMSVFVTMDVKGGRMVPVLRIA